MGTAASYNVQVVLSYVSFDEVDTESSQAAFEAYFAEPVHARISAATGRAIADSKGFEMFKAKAAELKEVLSQVQTAIAEGDQLW